MKLQTSSLGIFCIFLAMIRLTGGGMMMMHHMMKKMMHKHHHDHDHDDHKGISLSFKPIPIPIPIAYVDKGHMKAEPPWPQESKSKGMMMEMMKMKMKYKMMMMKGMMKGMKKMKKKKCCPMQQNMAMAWPMPAPMTMCPHMKMGCNMMMPAMKACPMKAAWPKKQPMMCDEPEEEEEEEEPEVPEEVSGWPDYYEREMEEDMAGWDTRTVPVYSAINRKGDDLEDAGTSLGDGIVWVRVRRASEDGVRPKKEARKSFDYDFEYF